MKNVYMAHTILAGILVLCCASLTIATASTDLTQGSAEEAGDRIAKEARGRQRGYGNFSANMTMTLRTKSGRESQRILRIIVMETETTGERTLFVFDRPANVKGTAFLIHAHKDKPDQQWLFLPALKRVKGISSSNQSGSFMGSEFSYEDLGTSEVEKYVHRYLRDEPCDDLTCFVIERVPNDKDSGYSKLLIWMDQAELRTVKVDFFDRRGAHLKTMVAQGFEKYLDKYWRSSELKMTNHLTKKETDLSWSNFQFGLDLNERDFSKTALKRVK